MRLNVTFCVFDVVCYNLHTHVQLPVWCKVGLITTPCPEKKESTVSPE